jgi:hypothetical protein
MASGNHPGAQRHTTAATQLAVAAITLGGDPVATDAAGLVSLTDLHKAALARGLADGKRTPGDWSREAGAPFIEFVAEHLNTRKAGIYRALRGKGGGTFAHWQIALAYAKYLSPELHMQVNEVYARFKSADVTLAADVADRAKPQDAEWLARRVQGTVARNRLTSTLAAHGVSGKGYADCTNAIYRNVLGGKKSEVCAARGLRRGTNLRDVMDSEQLTLTAMSELVARRRIEQREARGNQACTDSCDHAAWSVVNLMHAGAQA